MNNKGVLLRIGAFAILILAITAKMMGQTLSVNVTTKNILCHGECSGEANIQVSGGTLPYHFKWSSQIYDSTIGTTEDYTRYLCSGTYYFTVSDVNAASITDSIVITQPSAPLSAIIGALANVPCNGSAGSVSFAISGGTLPYSVLNYHYSANGSVMDDSLSRLTAGPYVCNITDSNNCFTSVVYSIGQLPAITVSIAKDASLCAGVGQLSILASGGVGNDSVSLNGSPFQLSPYFNTSASGNYVIEVKDSGGCSLDTTFVNLPFADSISATSSTCNSSCNATATVIVKSGAGGYSYNWGSGVVDSFLCPGTYTVSITDLFGCVFTDSVTITSQMPYGITLLLTADSIPCYGEDAGTIIVFASGGIGVNSFSTSRYGSFQISDTLFGFSEGQQEIFAKDSNGCTATGSINIPGPAPLTVGISVSNACNKGTGSALITASGGTPPYNISVTLYTDSATIAIDSFDNLTSGFYLVNVTDAHSCNIIDSFYIDRPPTFSVSIAKDAAICTGSTGTLTVNVYGGTGPDSISLNGSPYQISPSFTGVSSSTYVVNVKDANECTFNTTFNSPVFTDSISAFSSTCMSSCNGGAYVYVNSGAGGYSYNWDNSGGGVDTIYHWNYGNYDSGLCAGTYKVSITDAYGCLFRDSITVANQLSYSMSLTLVADSILCFGTNTGTIIASVQGGVGVDSFKTLCCGTFQISDTLTGIYQGGQVVEVKDDNGCIATNSINVPSVPQPLAGPIFGEYDSSTCPGTYTYYVNDQRGMTFTWTLSYFFTDSGRYIGGTDSTDALIPNGDSVTVSWANPNPSGSRVLSVVAQGSCGLAGQATVSTFNISDSASCANNTDVWPGDANNDGVVDNNDVLNIGLQYGFTGQQRPNASLAWVGQPASVWTDSLFAAINSKYADCDGNGIINADDTFAITLNYSLTHPKGDDRGDNNAPALYIQFPAGDTVQAGQTVQVPIYLGTSTMPISAISGVAFSLNYDNSLISTTTVQLSTAGSWVGTDLLTFRKDIPNSSRTDIAISRIDHANAGGYGPLCTVSYIMKDDISGKTGISRNALFSVTGVTAVTARGMIVPLDYGEVDTVAAYMCVSDPGLSDALHIYPNPAEQYIIADAGNSFIDQYIITDLLGNKIETIDVKKQGQLSIDVSMLTAGMYFLRAKSGYKVATIKFAVLR